MVQAIAYVSKSKKIYWGDWRIFYWTGNSIEDYHMYCTKASKYCI